MEVWLFVVAGQIVLVARVVVGVVLGELGALGPVFLLYAVLPGRLGSVATAMVVLGVVVITVQIVGPDSTWHSDDDERRSKV